MHGPASGSSLPDKLGMLALSNLHQDDWQAHPLPLQAGPAYLQKAQSMHVQQAAAAAMRGGSDDKAVILRRDRPWDVQAPRGEKVAKTYSLLRPDVMWHTSDG